MRRAGGRARTPLPRSDDEQFQYWLRRFQAYSFLAPFIFDHPAGIDSTLVCGFFKLNVTPINAPLVAVSNTKPAPKPGIGDRPMIKRRRQDAGHWQKCQFPGVS